MNYYSLIILDHENLIPVDIAPNKPKFVIPNPLNSSQGEIVFCETRLEEIEL